MQTIPWVDKYRPKKLDDIVNQDEVIKLLKKTLETGQLPHLLFYGNSGSGKCLILNTPVIMFDGTIKMVQDIEKNDLLMGDDNQSRTVLGTIKGKDMMYRILQGNGDPYDVNSEHIISLKLSVLFSEIWYEKENKYKILWLENHEQKHKYFTIQQENKSNNKNNYKTKEDAYYALNLYKNKLIKKNIVNKKGDICDISIKDYINKPIEWKILYKGFKCHKINCWKKKYVELDPYIFGYSLGDDTSVNNLINNKHVPQNYKVNDVETRLQLLAGFLDATAYLNQDNHFEFCQKSKKVFDDIIFIVRSLGLTASVDKSKIINDIIYYRANIYGYGIEKIPMKQGDNILHRSKERLGTFYQPTKISFKKAREYEQGADSLQYEIQIEQLNYDDYYGFEIDGNKRFLLGDFTVTHNTSSALAVAYQLFGPKIFNERVIELNASDERGINVVRHKINTFARTAIGNIDPNYPSPPFKLVILDEADAMTTEAQSALRKVMEELSSITRFCFICNYKNQIIDPIVSRCMKFRFKPINKKSMHQKLLEVSIKENMKINDESINAICSIVKGDVRKAIMILQNLRYILNYKPNITKEDVYNITGYTFPEYIKPIWDLCLSKNGNIKKILDQVNKIKLNGIPITSILENLQTIVIDSNVDDRLKSKICIHIASTEKCLIDGSDEYIQLFNIFSYIYGLINKYTIDIPNNLC